MREIAAILVIITISGWLVYDSLIWDYLSLRRKAAGIIIAIIGITLMVLELTSNILTS